MRKSICGCDCDTCSIGKNVGCAGCTESMGCPFGKQCFIAEYIQLGGQENYRLLKEKMIDEINALDIPGMPKIHELYALCGAFVNLAYPMPSGDAVKLLDDRKIYLGNQVECEYDDGSQQKCFGMVAGLNFLLVSEYGENGRDPEIVIYKRR